jgi:hypothetical protein
MIRHQPLCHPLTKCATNSGNQNYHSWSVLDSSLHCLHVEVARDRTNLQFGSDDHFFSFISLNVFAYLAIFKLAPQIFFFN